MEEDWVLVANRNDKHWYVYSNALDKYAETEFRIYRDSEEEVWNALKEHGVHEEAWTDEMWG